MFRSGEGVADMSDEEILRWMRENYPQYADNIELARMLYRRLVQKKKVPRNDSVKAVKISELKKPKMRVRIRGVIVEKSVSEYVGCAICKRKNCKEHHAGTKRYKFTNFLVGDDTGVIWVGYGDEIPFEVGDEVEVVGRTKVFRDNIEVMADSVEGLVDEREIAKIEEIVDFVRESVRVKEDVLKKICKKAGVRFEKVMRRDELRLGDEGWIYWVGGDE